MRRSLRGPRWYLVIAGGVVALFVLAASCGVPLDSEPELVSADELHPELVRGETATTEPASGDADQAEEAAVRVYFVGPEGNLLPRTRQAVPTPRGVLDALLDGPLDDERQEGIGTALSDVELVSVEDPAGAGAGTIVFVRLTEDSLSRSDRKEQLTAFGQMVYTLTNLDGVTLVSFTRDGDQVPILTDDGTVDPATAVRRSDYASLTPPARPGIGFADETGQTSATLPVYFVTSENKLQEVPRSIDSSAERLMADLFIGPSVSETRQGLGTRITDEALLLQNITFEPELQTAIIDLVEGSLPQEVPLDRRLAIAQIVYTMTELPNVAKVQLSVDGLPQGLEPTDDIQPFERQDFVDLLAFAP